MGAGTALQAALKPESSGITAMILDSTFLIQPDMLVDKLRDRVPFLKAPFAKMINWTLPLVGGERLNSVPYEKVNNYTYSIPILMIHGQKDMQSSHFTSTRIFQQQQSQPRSAIWLPPDRGHEMTYRFQTAQYLQRTLQFLHEISTSSMDMWAFTHLMYSGC